MNISITGAAGQLGREFQDLAANYPHWHFHFADRSTADISRQDQVFDWLEDTQPAVVINCAAYTNVNKAESEPGQARLINVDAVGALAKWCAQRPCYLIHYSSDYVYHTEQSFPYRETDATHPKSVYAATKLAGEQLALQQHPLTTIIRTSWVYSAYGHNFVKTMLRLGRERDTVSVVEDQIGTPTYAHDLAQATLDIIHQTLQQQQSPERLAGIYNFSNSGVCSWYDLAIAVFELAGIDCQVLPVDSGAFPSPAQRPHYSVLSKEKYRKTFIRPIPHWRDALQRCLQRLL